MKKLLIITMLVITATLTAQDDKWFISAGFDPAILFNIPKLDGEKRVGAGNLNYLVQAGREGFEKGKIRSKFGLQWEQFSEINYTAYSAFGGITFDGRYIPFTDWKVGDFWYLTAEINIIDRKGIQNSKIWNAHDYTSWGFGANLGIRFQEVFKSPVNFDILINGKDRPDIRTHYTGGTFDSINDIVFSVYLMATINF